MSYDHLHALAKGVRLNQYEMQGILGAGGFGITYLAHDTSLDTTVAIKEYLPGDFAVRQGDSTVTAKSSTSKGDFDWGLRRFLDEARVLAKFRHPNIVRVNQVFEANSTAYLVMEYAKGESLDEALKRASTFNEQQTKDIIFPILDGLKRVHALGFLHRDIKPGNIILREEGGPVLIDFGAARQAIETKSRAITSIVTEGYAPLEQYDPSGNQGAWTDIYALGGVAYKCLTGMKPPPATSRVRNDPLIPVAIAAKSPVSPNFAVAIEASLRVFENDRPQTIDEFIALVFGAAAPRAASAQTPETTRIMDNAATQVMHESGSVSAPSSFVSPPPPPPPPLQTANPVSGASVHPQAAQPTPQPMPAPPGRRERPRYLETLVPVALVLLVALGGWFYWQNRTASAPEAEPNATVASAVPSAPANAVANPSPLPPPEISAPAPVPTETPPQAATAPPPQPAVLPPAPQQPATNAPVRSAPTVQASQAPPPPPQPAYFKTSFDCARAAGNAEHLICSDRQLAALDLNMADLYRRGLMAVVDTNEFAGEQKTWLATQRDVCGDKACLVTAYDARLKELQRWLPPQ